MLSYDRLSSILGGSDKADSICPVCSHLRKSAHQKLKVLRVWRITPGLISYHCIHCEASGHVGDWKTTDPDLRLDSPKIALRRQQIDLEENARKAAMVLQLWRRSKTAKGSWAEQYLADRGLALPQDWDTRERTLRYLDDCPFPDGRKSPALIAGFTPIWTKVPDDPFDDPFPHAIHRIRGRGKGNKAMLGPVGKSAMMVSPWYHVYEHLHVCEGIETALGLYHGTKAVPEDDSQPRRPVWALGSEGAIRRFPVIERVKTLHVWADRDASGVSVDAARQVAQRWKDAGKTVKIYWLPNEGTDYADRNEEYWL